MISRKPPKVRLPNHFELTVSIAHVASAARAPVNAWTSEGSDVEKYGFLPKPQRIPSITPPTSLKKSGAAVYSLSLI